MTTALQLASVVLSPSISVAIACRATSELERGLYLCDVEKVLSTAQMHVLDHWLHSQKTKERDRGKEREEGRERRDKTIESHQLYNPII